MKKNRKIARLLFLASLGIAAIMTACPSTESSGGGGGKVSSKLSFTGLGLDSDAKKIIAYFDKDLSNEEADKPVASKITVKKGDTILKWGEGKDYTLEVEGGKLIIMLTEATESAKYTVALKAGAVKDADGETNAASTKDFTKGTTTEPAAANTNKLLFGSGGNSEKLKISFEGDITIGNASKIKVQWKTSSSAADDSYIDAEGTAAMDPEDEKVVWFTLSSSPSNGNFFQVMVEPGAVFAGTDPTQLTNTANLDFGDKEYIAPLNFTGPGKHSDADKIVAYFNKDLSNNPSDLDKSRITVKKGDDTLTEGAGSDGYTVAVSGRTLVIDLTDNLEENTKYTVELEAEAVTATDGTKNLEATKEFTQGTDTEPAKDSDSPLGFSTARQLKIKFDQDVTIGDASRIKVSIMADDSSSSGPALGTAAVDPEDKKIVVFTLGSDAQEGNIFSVRIEPGAVFAGTDPTQLTNTANLDFAAITYGTGEFNFTGLGNATGGGGNILVYFSEDLSEQAGDLDKSKIIVKKGANALEEGSESGQYGLTVSNGKLLIDPVDNNFGSDTYEVEVQAGAVKSTKGSTINTPSTKKQFTRNTDNEPVERSDSSLEFSSPTQLRIAFERDVTIGDASKIKVERKTSSSTGSFGNAQGTATLDTDPKVVVFTLDTAASNGNLFKATVESGAVFVGTDPTQLTNTADLEFSTITYGTDTFNFTGLGLDVSNNILVYFDQEVSTQEGDLDRSKIIVTASGRTLNEGISNDYTILDPSIGNRNIQIVLVSSIQNATKYEVEVQAGAIRSTTGSSIDAASTKKEFTHPTTSAPAVAGSDPLTFGTATQLKIKFDRTVTIGDASKIKVERKTSSSAGVFGNVEGTAALDGTDQTVVVFTLGTPAVENNLFRATVEPGAVFAGAGPVKFTNTANLDFTQVTYTP